MDDDYLATILEGIGEGFYAVDGTWRITLFNREASRHFGRSADEMLGKILWEVFPDAKETPLGQLFLRTMADRQAVRSETSSVIIPGGRWLAYRLFPLADGMGVVFRDVTDRKRAEEALSESEALFRNLADSLPHLIWVMRPDGFATYFNRRFKEYHGYEVGAELEDRSSNVHPEDLPGALALRARTIPQGLPFEMSMRLKRADGEYRWFRMSAEPLWRDGELAATVGIAIDIHDMRRAEEQLKRHVRHQDLLINELNHRVKNTMTIVQSIAMQTLRDTDPGLRQAFQARLGALAGAYDVLTRQSWERADIHHIVERAVAPFRDSGREQFHIAGDARAIDSGTALTLAMALHELGTNAAKYGALSVPAGRVAVDWSRQPEDGFIRLRWAESGGPPVIAPTRTGFGSRLLQMSFRDGSGGGVQTTYAAHGIVCEMLIPPRQEADANLHGVLDPGGHRGAQSDAKVTPSA